MSQTIAAVLLVASLVVPQQTIAAQDTTSALYMPRSVKRAFAMGTRLPNGRPGSKYWQNRARYSIDVSVTPPAREVRGVERITYFNNSPDTLKQLTIKLFMNVHRPGASRNRDVTPAYLTNGVQIDSFAVNGAAAPWPRDASTNAPIPLAKPLMPHDSIQLAFRWRYDLATEPAREGVIDSTTFYIAYFYPRVAVYDDYAGWDTMEFTDLQEFYGDFNDYDVTVHAPPRYVVWGTGTLTNASEVLAPATFRRFKSSLGSDATTRLATKQEMSSGTVTAPGAEHAWHFTSSNVPDVAFGLSDHYDWDAASVVVDEATHQRVSVQAAYNDSAADFHSIVQMARQSLAFLSREWPGIPYPYEKTTVFQGGAGMEYPMLVNDESYADTAIAHFVLGHEIAHTYMPFYMGVNETRYAFMDEGWAAAFEYLLNRRNMGDARATELFRQVRIEPWTHETTGVGDIPIITPSDAIRNPIYRMNAYGKAALGYLAVKDYLGDSLFARTLHAYMDRWHGRHPTPWDFFNAFNDASGRDLNWFWRDWYFGNEHIDIAVRSVATTSGGHAVTLDNVGGLAAPVDLVLTFADGSTQRVHETIGIWKRDLKRATISVPGTKALRTVELSDGIWMDTDHANDKWRAP